MIDKFCAAPYKPTSSIVPPSIFSNTTPMLEKTWFNKENAPRTMPISKKGRTRTAMCPKSGSLTNLRLTTSSTTDAPRLPSMAPGTDKPASTNTRINASLASHRAALASAR
jgi:hypothetical protein